MYCRNYLTRQASGFSDAFTNALAADVSNFKVKTDGLKNGERPIGYLFYETQDEVDDIPSIVDIEAGGSITTNWFSWVENQLCQNNTGSQTINGVTFTNNGDGS